MHWWAMWPQVSDGIWTVSVGSGSTAWFSPERRLRSDIHLLQAQVPCGRGLTWAAGDRRDWQATEEEVHGGEKGLQETDRAESGASMGGEVDFIGVRTGRPDERLILTGRPGDRETRRSSRAPKATTFPIVLHIYNIIITMKSATICKYIILLKCINQFINLVCKRVSSNVLFGTINKSKPKRD